MQLPTHFGYSEGVNVRQGVGNLDTSMVVEIGFYSARASIGYATRSTRSGDAEDTDGIPRS